MMIDTTNSFPKMERSQPSTIRSRRLKNQKRLAIGGAIFLSLVLVAMWIDPSRWFILGTVNGDRFYGGWPTRYWAERLKDRGSIDPVVERLSRGGKDAVPVLVELLGNSNPVPREAAALALSRIVADAEEAIPGLVKALRDEDDEVKRAAIPPELGRAQNSSEVLHSMVNLAGTISTREYKNVGAAARLASALAGYGPAAKSAVPSLENWLPLSPSTHREEIETIHRALKAIDPAAAARIIVPDEWWRGFEKMRFVGENNSLAGMRYGKVVFVENGTWEEKPNLKAKDFDFADGTNVKLFTEALLPWLRKGEVYCEVYAPGGFELALGFMKTEKLVFEVLILDTIKGELRSRMETFVRPTLLTYSSDGTKLAVASELGYGMDVFDSATGKLLSRIETDWTQIRPVFCNQAQWVTTLAGKGRNAIRLWDAANGKLIKELDWHREGEITAIAVSTDGNRLATSDSQGWIRIWDLPNR